MTNIKNELKSKFPKILLNEDLSKYSTYHVGGEADYFFIAKTTQDLIDIINYSNKKGLRCFIIGAGSNILFDDKGFRGIIIKNETDKIEINNDEITADSGVFISKIIKKASENSLTGLEKWIGLPGTVGGAVRGNAGCNGLETKDILSSAEIFDPKTGKTKEVDNNYFKFKYRESKLKHTNKIVLNATFKLKKQKLSPEKQKEITLKIQKSRHKTQPIGLSSGSFFKNPSPDKPAGMLIDKAGLKGKTIGKAQISEKHGNFILNLGGAATKDILSLAKLAKREVKTKFGINLHEEVQILSETGPTKL